MHSHLKPSDSELSEIMEESVPEKEQKTNSKKLVDKEYIKKAFSEVIIEAEKSIKDAALLASCADNPKAYSSLASLINCFSSLSEKFLDLDKPEKGKEPEQGKLTQNIQQAVIFQGSKEDLMEKLEKGEIKVEVEKDDTEKPI